MARPTKKRKISELPLYTEFQAVNAAKDNPEIVLSLEEYETLRLMDYQGMTQQECAAQMDVSRTTVQALYTYARKRLAACLVEGRPLRIAGGNYELDSDNSENLSAQPPQQKCIYWQKGQQIMKLAVTYLNDNIFPHFGKTNAFKIYTINDKEILDSEVFGVEELEHGQLIEFLKNQQVDAVICGQIGGGAQGKLAQAGISLYGGVKGNADQAVEDFLAGKLAYDPAVHCSHYDQKHGANEEKGHHGHMYGKKAEEKGHHGHMYGRM